MTEKRHDSAENRAANPAVAAAAAQAATVASEGWSPAESLKRRDSTNSTPSDSLSLALSQAQAGRFNARTRPIYQEALRHAPANAALQKALSISYLVEGVEKKLFAESDESKPLNNEAILESLEIFEGLFRRHPESVDVCKTLADLEMFSGKGYEAIGRYERAARLGWEDPRAIGRACRAAIKRASYSDDVLLHVSSLLEELGASSDAVAITRVVVLRSTTETYVLNLFARQLELALRESPDPTDRGKLRLELATSLRKLGKRDEALVHLREFKPGEVSSPELVKRLARLLIDAGDHRAAFDHIKNIPLDEEAKTLVNDITLALEREGEMDTALYLLQYINSNDAALKEAMELKERTIELDAELQFAELHAKGGRFGEAFRKFVEVILAGYEPVDEVLGQVDAILAKLPISAYGGLLQLGAHCLKIERFQQAIHYLNRVLQAYPDEREALALLRKAYDKIIEVHPTVLEVRFKSGRLYERMGERDKAIEEFERCLASEELRNRARREIALCRVHAREHDKALAQYAKMRIEEEDCEPLYAIYEACRDRNPKRALDALGLVRKCNPQYRDIVAKIAALEERLRKTDGKIIEDPKMKELIGNLAVGRYRYIGKIGSGGMGIVHKVFDMKNNMVVAMKILREGLASSGKAIDRFYREARIAAKLNHPNIVNIYDYSINNVQGHSYITMEFVDGPSLRDLIERKFAATIDIDLDDVCEALDYMIQICGALEATHAESIIHRDIKPDNVLVNSEGVVKITDFGIVHVEEATFTPTGAMVGTPRYMSPEQIQGRKLDGRSDLYAAGIILYELLVSHPPFSSGDISYQHIHMPPPSAKDLSPAIPDEVNNIINKCLAKSPDDRYANAVELCKAVTRALANVKSSRPVDLDTNMIRREDLAGNDTLAFDDFSGD